MKKNNVNVIQGLAKKKVELLEQLLRQSQQFSIEANEQKLDNLLEQRKNLISFLGKNDDSIQTWEGQTGQEAQDEVPGIYEQIGFLMESIQENNDLLIEKLEGEKQRLNQEKAQLNQGNKLSGYIRQKSKVGSFKPSAPLGRFRKPTY